MRRAFVLICTAAIVAAGFAAITAAPAGAAPMAYTIQVDDDVQNGCRLATIDLATGTVSGIGSYLDYDSYVCAHDLAFGPNGVLYGISDNEDVVNEGDIPQNDGVAVKGPAIVEFEVHLVTFNTTTGAVTDVGRIGTDEASLTSRDGAGGIAFDANGNLFVSMVGIEDACDDQAFCLYKVDPASVATPTFIGPMLGETYLLGLTTTCTTMYSSHDISLQTQLSVIDPATAGVTGVGTAMGQFTNVYSLEIDPATGTLWGLGFETTLGRAATTSTQSTPPPA